MAGPVLSAEVTGSADARFLCGTPEHGGNQLYVSGDPEALDARRMGSQDTGAFSLRAQGAAAYNAFWSLTRRRGYSWPFRRNRYRARRTPGADSFSAPARLRAKRSRPRGVPRDPRQAGACRFRVSPSLMVRFSNF